MLGQAEHVASRLAHRVPPASAAVVDDQHLARAAAVFQALRRTFLLVEQPARLQALQQHGAAHARPQLIQFNILSAHRRAPARSGRAVAGPDVAAPALLSPSRPDPLPAPAGAGCGARAGAARERGSATHPCGAACGGGSSFMSVSPRSVSPRHSPRRRERPCEGANGRANGSGIRDGWPRLDGVEIQPRSGRALDGLVSAGLCASIRDCNDS